MIQSQVVTHQTDKNLETDRSHSDCKEEKTETMHFPWCSTGISPWPSAVWCVCQQPEETIKTSLGKLGSDTSWRSWPRAFPQPGVLAGQHGVCLHVAKTELHAWAPAALATRARELCHERLGGSARVGDAQLSAAEAGDAGCCDTKPGRAGGHLKACKGAAWCWTRGLSAVEARAGISGTCHKRSGKGGLPSPADQRITGTPELRLN